MRNALFASRSLFCAIALASTVAGCATMVGTVRERAAQDLDCPTEMVTVSELPGSAFHASGCGGTATYACRQGEREEGLLSQQHRSPWSLPPPIECTAEETSYPRARPSTPPARAEEASLPLTPDHAAVREAMEALAPQMRACSNASGGTVTVTMTFAGLGVVTNVRLPPEHAGTVMGSCVARAALLARIPPFRRASITVTYPFLVPAE